MSCNKFCDKLACQKHILQYVNRSTLDALAGVFVVSTPPLGAEIFEDLLAGSSKSFFAAHRM
jgi:hypothetical protein